jgi:phosphatidylglycerophosphate synthase
MTIYAHFIEDSAVRIWGLTSRQRKTRVLRNLGITDIVEDVADIPNGSSVLMFRGDYLFDDRIIAYLVKTPRMLLTVSQGSAAVAVAAHVSSSQAADVREVIAGQTAAVISADLKNETLETLSVSFQQQLLKFEPPFVLPITAENARKLERRLFDWSYKGVTDLVTKWAWPRPAQWVVGQCVRLGLRPNHVTIIGLLLVILAGIFFAQGRYGWGLLAGWLMTFLDTVDGKLARVTVTSSKFGHYFDHIIDLIHPPVWYILWGIGLGIAHFDFSGMSLGTAYWLIVLGYAAGRLAEGVFLAWLGKFGIFCWRPTDSYFRLITARRNPCMVLLTAGLLMGRPDWGLLAVTIWTVATSIFLIVRLFMALNERLAKGTVKSWFMDIGTADRPHSLAVRLFTHRAE